MKFDTYDENLEDEAYEQLRQDRADAGLPTEHPLDAATEAKWAAVHYHYGCPFGDCGACRFCCESGRAVA